MHADNDLLYIYRRDDERSDEVFDEEETNVEIVRHYIQYWCFSIATEIVILDKEH